MHKEIPMTIGLSPINNSAVCDELHDQMKGDYMSLHPESLVIPDDRLRDVDPQSIPGLAESIKEVGQMCAIGVKRHGQGKYRVVYGARRTMAMQLLLRQALKNAKDPNTDQDVQRFGSMHALVYRNEITDETCRELEARENADRKELDDRERGAHTVLVEGFVKQRQDMRKHINKTRERCDKHLHLTNVRGRSFRPKTLERAAALGIKPSDPAASTSPNSDPVDYETGKMLGISTSTVRNRRKAISVLANMPEIMSPDVKPEDLKKAALKVLAMPPEQRNSAVPSKGRINAAGRTILSCNIYPSDAGHFATWIRKRYPVSFTLDQIRAYRDALIGLVEELEKEA
jgi:ParB/Sulfiredoxin domain